MKTCKAAPTPGTDALKKGKAELAEALSPEEHQQYRKLVGQLLWLCNLRMDIMYAVKELSRGLAAPTTDHSAKSLSACFGTCLVPRVMCKNFVRRSAFRKSIPHLMFTLMWTVIGPVILTLDAPLRELLLLTCWE